MLKLFWTPAKGGAPAEVDWQGRSDGLRADALGNAPLQQFARTHPAVALPSPALAARLNAWLAHRSHGAPLTIMAHGYSYNSMTDGNDPFHSIYGIPGPGTPGHLSILPLVGECDEQGGSLADVALAFAWLSSGTMAEYGAACWDNDYKLAALDLAPLAARALATIIAHLAARNVPVRIVAHSLGTRLVTQAIGWLRAAGTATSIERVVLLEGAEFCVDAAEAYDGCRFDVVNIASSKDVVLAMGAQQACHPVRYNGSPAARVIGRTGLGGNPRWFDLQIDRGDVVAWAASGQAPTGRRYQVNALPEDNVHPAANLAHWACYTNAGNRLLVADLVRHPAMTVDSLRNAGAPDGVEAHMYGRFNGLPIPQTPDTCAERRGEILVASGASSSA